MTTRRKFFESWRSWTSRIQYVLSSASRFRVRCEIVLELKPASDALEDDIHDDVHAVLPGWQAMPQSDGWWRLTPPTR